MIILQGNKQPVSIYYGNRPVRNVFVGSKLVWPEATLYGIKSVAVCKTHAAFVLNDGTLWTMGSNIHGQLCRIAPSGSWSSQNLAVVPDVTDAKAVVVSNTEEGNGSTVVLRDHNRIWSAGFSTSPAMSVTATNNLAITSLGRQGSSGSPTFSNFTEVLGLSGIRKLWHGRGQLLVERNNGLVYGFGLDWDANRGLFKWMEIKDIDGIAMQCTDLSLQSRCIVHQKSDGTVATLGLIADWTKPAGFTAAATNVLKPSADGAFLSGIRKVSTGLSHLAAVTRTGFLHVAGSDQYGQLATAKAQYRNPQKGFLLDEEQVVDVACGDHHTVILCRNGRVKTAGRNHRGQLGRPIPVGNGHDWVYYTGSDRVSQEGWFGNCSYIPGIENAIAVYAGGDTTMIFCEDGIYVAGDNEFGQLGTATERHLVNSDDRISWRESWSGPRVPFETNTRKAELFGTP